MRLICPSCSTHYDIDHDKITTTGRHVKCASCDHVWQVSSSGEIQANLSIIRSISSNIPSSPRGITPNVVPRATTPLYGSGAATGLAVMAAHEYEHEERSSSLTSQFRPVHKPHAPHLTEIDSKSVGQFAKEEGTQVSPFHAQISALSDAFEIDEEKEQATVQRRLYPLRQAPVEWAIRSAKAVIKGFNALGDLIDRALEVEFWQRSESSQIHTSPGDIEVHLWRQRMRRKARNKMTPTRALGWCILLAYVCGAIYLVGFKRETVVSLWPSADNFYAWIGFPVGTQPVSLKGFDHRYAMSQKGPVIELNGIMTNVSSTPLPTPFIKATAFGRDGRVLTSWVFQVRTPSQLLPGMETPFFSRVLAPAEIAKITVSVVNDDERNIIEQSRNQGFPSETGESLDGQGFVLQRTMNSWDADSDPPIPAASK